MIEHFDELPRSPRLGDVVEAYRWLVGEGSLNKVIAPRAGAVLVFNLQGKWAIDGQTMPNAVFIGIRDRLVHLVAQSSFHDRVQALFRPWGAARFMKAGVAPLTNRIVPADEVLAEHDIERLLRKLRACQDRHYRVTVLDDFFEGLCLRPTARDRYIETHANKLANGESTSLTEVLISLGVSQRQFERLFVNRVGTRPKTFARIARFERAEREVLARNGMTLTDLSLALGYFDQSHFNREFKRLTSMSPGSFGVCVPP